MSVDVQENFSCDACQNSNSVHFYATVSGIDGKKYTLVCCDNCGVIVACPSPTKEFLDVFYSTGCGRVKMGILENKDSKVNLAPIEDRFVKLRYVEKYADIRSGRLLDVGCGHGFFLYAAKESGYEVQGMDIDVEAIQYGRSMLGVKTFSRSIDLLAELPKSSFNIITFWQVLEHLPMPGSCIREANSLLRGGGGIIAGSVPNIGGIGAKLRGKKWYMMIPPEHISYFDEFSFKTMLKHAGFEPLFIGTIPIYASPYFSFGIRPNIMKYVDRTQNEFLRFFFKILYRGLTLTKRYIIYLPLNTLIILLNLGGNSIFFVARKIE